MEGAIFAPLFLKAIKAKTSVDKIQVTPAKNAEYNPFSPLTTPLKTAIITINPI